MLKTLRNLRKLYKQWQHLPPEERDRYATEIQHIRSLVVGLGGERAWQYVEAEQADDAAADVRADTEASASSGGRSRKATLQELSVCMQALLAEMAEPASQLVSDSVPRSARLAGKAAAFGGRAATRRFSRG